MAKRYRIKTIEDCARLVSDLPPDRAEVFLRELPLAIMQQAAVISAAKSVKTWFGSASAKASFPNGFEWIDDDKGESTLGVKVSVKSGETVLASHDLHMAFKHK